MFLKKNIGIIIILTYFILSTITIDNYGYTWDDKQEFGYAEANLNYILTKDTSVNSHIEGYRFSPSNAGNLLGVIIKRIFSDWLGILQKDNAYHFAGIIFGTLTLFLIYWFSKKEFGLKTAIIASLAFATYPRIFGHIHNNVKDITVMFAFTICIISVYYLWTKKERKWLYITTASLSFAFNTKFLTSFIIPIVIIWFLIDYFVLKNKKIKKFRKIKKIDWIKAVLVFIIILYALNPAYWIHPSYPLKTAYMLNHFENGPYESANKGYPNLIFGKSYLQSQTPKYFIPLMFLIVTPVATLLLFLIGVFNIFKKKYRVNYLLLLWLIFPILMYVILNITIYNIIRHVLFLVPALCLIVGIGAKKIIDYVDLKIKDKKIKGYLIKNILYVIFVLILFIVPIIDIVKYHPYQTTYFNKLIGGIQGANEKFEIEYWGNSYKEGSKWINEHAENGSTVVVPITYYIPAEYLRKDVILKKEIGSTLKNEFYVMYMRDLVDYNTLIYTLESTENPEYSIKVKGVPILNIYKLNSAISD